ncbi:hypothetical protein HQ496_02060 [bacterium]|nr:hypothetical protein [bacterium]
MLKIPYTDTFPESLVRSIAEFCLNELQARQTDSFWGRLILGQTHFGEIELGGPGLRLFPT